MQALFNSLRQKNSSLIRSLIKSKTSNVDCRYPEAGRRMALHTDRTTPSKDEMETLLMAVQMRNAFLVRKLIKSNSIDINYIFYEYYESTLLHAAASVGSLEIVKILVEEGHAEMNFTNELGEVPIHHAADNSHLNIVRYLAEKGSLYTEDVEFLLQPGAENIVL